MRWVQSTLNLIVFVIVSETRHGIRVRVIQDAADVIDCAALRGLIGPRESWAGGRARASSFFFSQLFFSCPTSSSSNLLLLSSIDIPSSLLLRLSELLSPISPHSLFFLLLCTLIAASALARACACTRSPPQPPCLSSPPIRGRIHSALVTASFCVSRGKSFKFNNSCKNSQFARNQE